MLIPTRSVTRLPRLSRLAAAGAFVFFTLLSVAARGGDLSFFGETEKDPLAYAPGEEIVFNVRLLENGAPCAGKTVRWVRVGDDGKVEEGEAVTDADEPVTIRTAIETPGFVWLKVVALDEAGNSVPGENHEFNGGAGVLLDRLESAPEPDDFDAFWARQKERLAEIPPEARLTKVDSPDDAVVCYDLRVDSLGAPVSGYFCLPADAKEKSLPALLVLQGYGVASAGKEIQAGKTQLALCINAHGIENGRDPEFYQNLFDTTLRNYGFSAESNADPETSYWNGVAMRVMRALEFLKSRPEWDGKNLTVSGGSQGGFQSILGAALDGDVTSCHLAVPWFCDVSGAALQGRIASIFRSEWTDALGYYDGVNHAKRIKCPVTISAGLGDYVCPPSGVMTLYNNLRVPVKLEFTQGNTHGYSMPGAPKYRLEKNR